MIDKIIVEYDNKLFDKGKVGDYNRIASKSVGIKKG